MSSVSIVEKSVCKVNCRETPGFDLVFCAVSRHASLLPIVASHIYSRYMQGKKIKLNHGPFLNFY